MTASNLQLEKIRASLASVLPTLLTTAGLADFDLYTVGPPKNAESKTLSVYLSEEVDDEDFYYLRVLIQCQLYRVANESDYHSIIFEAIRENVTPLLMGIDRRSSIAADVWPLNKNVSTSFIYYEIEFTEEMDDCD
jgi:hypothetical protein